ncbi:cation-binding protein [Porphyromonas crevioricanis]|nr:hemerythrin domain-containing protein [Porphyromonas crevioricanis]KGN89925.1 cation-binding protein [Porphyromonas crevioricanis]KGN94110.1 cation-binding protein [Porphyromonas crevioricanis]
MTNKPLSRVFSAQTKMSDLICAHYNLLLVITRFGIHLGFGEKTIGEVCQSSNVDTPTLLTILNAVANIPQKPKKEELKSISMNDLLTYLRNAHDYFLNFRLPLLRQQLVSAISNCPQEVAFAIRKFFDDYVEEVNKHMSYEEKTVFPYAEHLAKGERDDHYKISIFRRKHDQIEAKISELKAIIIKYYPAPSGYELNSVLHDIFSCEEDLASHNFIEDHIFIPLMEIMEQQTKKG